MFLQTRIMSDIHGPAMGGVAKAEQVFAEPPTSKWGAMNLETNCGDHTMHRALTEAKDLNLFFGYSNPALRGRAASFCMERYVVVAVSSGHETRMVSTTCT